MSAKSFNQLESPAKVLSWSRCDIEQRLFFAGNRFTRVNTVLSFLLAVLLTLAFHGVLLVAPGTWLHSRFIGQGPVPGSIAFFSAWCLAILFLKWRKLALQKQCLKLSITPDAIDFVLSPNSVNRVFDRMDELVDDPRQFMLFNRISIALSNLKNIGRVRR